MRDPRIATLVETLERALAARLRPDSDAWPVACDMFEVLRQPKPAIPKPAIPKPGFATLAMPEMLATTLEAPAGDNGDLSRLASTVMVLAPDLGWWTRTNTGVEPATFTNGHAVIVGPGGFEDRDDAQIGISLLAPNFRYPEHHHPPPEVYLALTPGAWWKDGDSWFEPGIGGTVFNEPNVLHAMKSHDVPLFAFWCMPLRSQ